MKNLWHCVESGVISIRNNATNYTHQRVAVYYLNDSLRTFPDIDNLVRCMESDVVSIRKSDKHYEDQHARSARTLYCDITLYDN